MHEFSKTGIINVDYERIEKNGKIFKAGSGSNEQTLETIKGFYEANSYLLDPHTAVGVAVGNEVRNPQYPLVCLATAHPAKFGDVVKKATGLDPDLPTALSQLASREKKLVTISADKDLIKNYISANAI
jgi:threonine synthase